MGGLRRSFQFDSERHPDDHRVGLLVFMMTRLFSDFVVRVVLMLGVGLCSAAAAVPAELLEKYFTPAEIMTPKLSPSGEFIGVVARKGDAFALGIYDLKAGKQRLVGGSANVHVVNFWWKGARRLIVQTTDAYGMNPGLMMVDIDGGNPVDLWRIGRLGQLIDPLPEVPDRVLLGTAGSIVRVNLQTGKKRFWKRVSARSADGWSIPPVRCARRGAWRRKGK